MPEGEPAAHLDTSGPIGAAVLLRECHGQGIPVLQDGRDVRRVGADARPDHPDSAADVEEGRDSGKIDPLRDGLEKETGSLIDIEAAEKSVRKAEAHVRAAEPERNALVCVRVHLRKGRRPGQLTWLLHAPV